MFKSNKIYIKIIIFFFTIISSSVGEEIKIPKYDWSFKGITGKFDRSSFKNWKAK